MHFIIIGVCLSIGIYLSNSNNELDERTVSISATIVAMDNLNSKGNIYVYYEYENKIYSYFPIKVKSGDFELGEKIDILINPKNPSDCKFKNIN